MPKHFLIGLARRLVLTCSMLTVSIFFGMQVLPASAQTWSFVRVIHASPDAGIVDVFMDGTKTLSNFQFGTVTGYAPVTVGAHKIQIAVIGTGLNASVLTQSIDIQANTPYTIAALGTKATGFWLQVFSDNNLVVGNTAKVRVYHLSPGTGTVDVTASGKMLVSGLTYANASNYVDVPSGSNTFDVTTTQDNSTMPVSAQIKPWTVTSIFAVGTINGTPQFQFVNAQVNGTPGLPGTGSDPHALPSNLLLPWPWVWGIIALIVVATSMLTMLHAKSKQSIGTR